MERKSPFMYVTSHVDPIVALLVSSFDFEVFSETDIMNMISEDHDIVDIQDVEPSSQKRKKDEVTNMVGATRKSKNQKVITQMESEENHHQYGFHWWKYGGRAVIGNANPRITWREGETTYDGMHEHAPPVGHKTPYKSVLKNLSSLSMSQDPSNRTAQLGRQPYCSSASQLFSSPLPPQLDMTQLYMARLSKLPSFPVNKNHVL
ncbi:PREDICTED: probable WRKY transcription factor 10 [Brassica oleracea var. oleracea]|uniref:probable WRKY transcription factor 10 n=1 Tax=Brassica oleracea var. oleracea TaxID=109376 RepID=UPI0006A750F0|nr:PREDICTED: probable WRKY transcription factor 10 [Brassica oleracea var. oleracea]